MKLVSCVIKPIRECLRRKGSSSKKIQCVQGHILFELYHISQEINFSLLTIVKVIGYTLHKTEFFDVPGKYLHWNKNLVEHQTEGSCPSGCVLSLLVFTGMSSAVLSLPFFSFDAEGGNHQESYIHFFCLVLFLLKVSKPWKLLKIAGPGKLSHNSLYNQNSSLNMKRMQECGWRQRSGHAWPQSSYFKLMWIKSLSWQYLLGSGIFQESRKIINLGIL